MTLPEEYNFFIYSEKGEADNVKKKAKEKGQVQDLPLHSGHDKILISAFNPHHKAEPPRADLQSDPPSG